MRRRWRRKRSRRKASFTGQPTSPEGHSNAFDAIRFEGHGVKSLSQFRVRGPSTLFWTNSGSFFQISSYGGYCDEGAVTSGANRGRTYIPPGRYAALRVRAIGKWTITIRRGVEKVGTPITFSGSGQRALLPSGFGLARRCTGRTQARPSDLLPGPKLDAVISSRDHRGRKHLPAGRYRLFVNATEPEQPSGSWRIVIR
jgi:hypothetical protein